MMKNSVLFVDQLSEPAVCSGLKQVSLGSGKCLHLAHSSLPVLPHLGPWFCGDPSQSSAHRTVYLTLKFSYQLHHPAVAARPKLFSIVRELNGARPSESTGLEAL